MQQLSVSEIQRNLHKLDSFDIIEVVDKKRQKVKGYFINPSYISFIEKLVSDKNRLMTEQLGGSLNIYSDAQLREHEEGAWQRHLDEKYKP
jgi:hypothetical protein